MSLHAGFDRHLFISYAHIDNQPLTPEQQGWVTRFHMALEAMLSMRIGRKAEIWRDAKLAGNDIFSDEILAQFPRTAVLVSVLSPRYVESDWCTREVRAFCEAAERSSALLVENKSRIIKVIKTPIDSEDPLPPVMKQVLGYPFFTLTDDQTPIELDPAYGTDIAQRYNLKIAKLAWDIAQLIKKLESTGAAAPKASARPLVYLSECSYDRREARDALESELRMHGYGVRPDAALPRDEAAYRAEVTRLLQQCALSVHLVGSLYGAVPDGPSQQSIVALQNELAVAESRARGLRRIIWSPEGTQSSSPEQQAFIQNLHASADLQFGADLITGDVQVVKAAVHDALKRIATADAGTGRTSADSSKLIYLICDPRDRRDTVPLRKVLQRAGFEVEIPVFAGDAATVRRANEDLLAQCDAVVLFYGAGDEAWKKTVENDIRKAHASRREKSPIVRFTYLASPATDDKAELLELEEPYLIDGLRRAPDDQNIHPLVQALRSA
jgi:hypothetical protein